MSADIWNQGHTVHITSFWGWSPETWGKVGYSQAGRRETVIKSTTDPYIMVVYITKQAPGVDRDTRGKIVGFYLVSHVQGHRDKFTDPIHHGLNRDQWQYALKALRAFSFVPEYQLDIDTFDPTIIERPMAVSKFGEEAPPERVELLNSLPFIEVPVYGGTLPVDETIQVPKQGQYKVRAGPVNRSGYTVDGEPFDTEKELYALRLNGDTGVFLGEPARDRIIFKIGLSISPNFRLQAFQKALPEGVFSWELYRTTRSDQMNPYSSFEAAKAGEDVMKDFLGQNADWLGGEFYAATPKQFNTAWNLGKDAAFKYDAQT